MTTNTLRMLCAVSDMLPYHKRKWRYFTVYFSLFVKYNFTKP